MFTLKYMVLHVVFKKQNNTCTNKSTFNILLNKHFSESLSTQLQPLSMPFYTTIPVMNHIPPTPQILQPCNLLYHNQV